jgi:glucose/arabinose dehydrogenase
MRRHAVVRSSIGALVLAACVAACAGGGSTTPSPGVVLPDGGGTAAPTSTPTSISQPTSTPTSTPTPAATTTPPAVNAALHVPSGFSASVIASIGGARELAALPNGDLLVATNGTTVYLIPGAENAGIASNPVTFANLPQSDSPEQGIAFGGGYVFVAAQYGVYRAQYTTGAQSGTFSKIASVRTGVVAPGTDGDVHHTSSIAVSGSYLYVGVGSSCNACTETDPTRATVQRMALDGTGMVTQATRIRNAMAFATDPTTGNVWAGGAGQDNLPYGHPYEFMDPVSTHAVGADYGWPACEEDHVAYTSGANCSSTIAPMLEFPAYSTLIGATFYPASQTGPYVFPSAWRGGLFVSAHGSWHTPAGSSVPADPPHVAFVPFSGGVPATGVNWSNPAVQWNDFFTGFQSSSGSRIGRTAGVAVGASGSLFVADDQTGAIYRIRPASSTPAAIKRLPR